MVFVYVTCKDKEEAKKISIILLTKRLIACSNIFPVNSIFLWNEKIQEENEVVMILKTKKDKFEIIKKEIKENHSYDVPCVCMINSVDNEEYGDYLNSSLR